MWVKHYKQLWRGENLEETQTQKQDVKGIYEIDLHELTEALDAIRKRKATGIDGINAELWKFGGLMFYLRLLHLYNRCWRSNSGFGE